MAATIRIGTRGSDLALWQARYLAKSLEQIGAKAELEIIKTQGDIIQHVSFDKMEGKGFFTKEIEQALLDGRVDVAVHSMKDLPTTSTPGLVIGAVSQRANPSDCLLIKAERFDQSQLFGLPDGALIGTSSVRRRCQMAAFRPDTRFEAIRGNVPTRIQKLRDGELDAIILASAGLERLELDTPGLVRVPLHPKEFIPAPAQGVLAYQTREQDVQVRKLLLQLHQADVAERTNVERRVLQLLEGGCQLPLGVYCERDGMGHYHVWGALGNADLTAVKKARLSQSTHTGLAEALLDNLKAQ